MKSIRFVITANWHYYLILALCVFFSFYFAIGAYPLFDNNEGLYANIAKYMVLHKDFIIPHANDVVYIEKPPLLYWLISLSFSMFGFTAFAARLVTVSSAALICALLVVFGKKIKNDELGLISAIIFASSIGVSIIARMVYFDMLFTFMVSGALLSFFYWHNSRSLLALRTGYIFCALAVLTKGLIALILIGGSFGVFLLLHKDYRKFYQLFDPVGIILFLLVALPWHIAATFKHQGFAWNYLVAEHFLRFLGQRQPHDYYSGPIYYYLPRIMIYIFPWSLYLPVFFWQKVRAIRWSFQEPNLDSSPTDNATQDDTKLKIYPSTAELTKFCWCWLLVPLIFFSISSAKANYYMIVGMPALAMIIGLSLKNLLNQPKIKQAFFGGAIVIIPLVLLMVWYINSHKDRFSSAATGIFLSKQVNKLPLYVYQDFEDISALFFYAPNSFKIIDTKSHDLYYGAKLSQYHKIFIDKENWSQELNNQPFYVVVAEKKLPEFKSYMTAGNYILLNKSGKLAVFMLTKPVKSQYISKWESPVSLNNS